MAKEPVNTDTKHFLDGNFMPLIDPGLLTEILATTADLSMLISAEGRVRSVMVNPHHPAFGQLQGWVGQSFTDTITEESAEKFVRRMEAILKPGANGLAIEVNHVGLSIWEFPVRYAMHFIEKDKSILMLGRDMRPIAEMQQQLVMAQIALERDYEAQREMDTRYRVLMESTRDAMVLLSMNSGRIVDINPAAAVLLGDTRQEFIGAAIAQEFEGRRRGEFLESLSSVASSDFVSPVELVARRSQRRVKVVPKLFRAAGERFLFCRIEAPEQVTASQSEIGENLERLYNDGIDGILFLNQDGVVEYANEAFLKLTDCTHLASVRGRSFADFMARGSVDLRVILDNAKRARHLRNYTTRLLSEFDSKIVVEISATHLHDRPEQGFALIIRDASRAEALRGPAFGGGEDGMRNVMELVGSSSLKDIVSETTDVVERMCIQSAVELTRNNRLAAAEMLGLSRQSLYVKLRKFGLLNRDDD